MNSITFASFFILAAVYTCTTGSSLYHMGAQYQRDNDEKCDNDGICGKPEPDDHHPDNGKEDRKRNYNVYPKIKPRSDIVYCSSTSEFGSFPASFAMIPLNH